MPAVEVSNMFTSNCVQVVAECDNGKKVTETITNGESILVGSDDQCRMRLRDTSVSPKHCLVRFQDSEVTLQDWCSENGTHVNGEPIDGISIISPDDRVQLGIYRLTFAFSKSAKSQTPASQTPASQTPASQTPASQTPASQIAATLESRTPKKISKDDSRANAVAIAGSSKPQRGDKLAHAGSSDAAQESFSPSAPPVQKFAAASRTMKSPDAATVAPRNPRDNPSLEQSTIELMKSEIELLQGELVEKDAQLRQLSEGNQGSQVQDPQSSHSDLERRIEQLLCELDQSDQRVVALEEISRLGEETQLADAEEKRQLGAWVDDIEKRIAEREAESQAECEVLQKRLERATEERDHLHQQVNQLAQSDGRGDPALEEIVQTLRQEVQALRQEKESLCEKVDAHDAAYEQQNKRCEELEQQTTGGGVEYIQQNVDEAMRAERLLVAQERAALSRQQLDLSNKVHEISREVERESRVHPVDDKFREFRKELKQIENKRDPPTVSQRLARLWQRLDGPTDRD